MQAEAFAEAYATAETCGCKVAAFAQVSVWAEIWVEAVANAYAEACVCALSPLHHLSSCTHCTTGQGNPLSFLHRTCVSVDYVSAASLPNKTALKAVLLRTVCMALIPAHLNLSEREPSRAWQALNNPCQAEFPVFDARAQ